jgi:hypothetical protein
MKYILITYRFEEGIEADWQQEIKRFIMALQNDPELKDKITYRCLKSMKGPEYYHLATVVDDAAAKLLNQRDFFKHYTEQNEHISGGTVQVTPLDLIAATD